MKDRPGPVFPVIPSYTRQGHLDLAAVAAYVKFLDKHGAGTLMTTAGTSQFNLLSDAEVMELNACAAANFSGRIICGLPCLAERLLAPIIVKTAERLPSVSIMLMYPERIYLESDVLGFFQRMTRLAPNRFYLHGLPMRVGTGGTRDYCATLVDKLTKAAPSLVGMKEESLNYESGFDLCASRLARGSFEFIVAGGSMRRFLLLQAAGAQSFFAGVGSLFPMIEIAFMGAIERGDLHAANHMISEFETPVFGVFMKLGWHVALRHAAKQLGLIGHGERRPMAVPSKHQRVQVEATVDALRYKVELALSSGTI